MTTNHTHTRFPYTALIVFSVAMGVLEAIVVVYVRAQYYPEGFDFPLKLLPAQIVLIEIIREITTLLMLGSVAWLSGKIFLTRLSAFLFTFGVWDITYYIALKAFLDWPESLLTFDILFLIPVAWVGPVLAPVICSVLMILASILFVYLYSREKVVTIKPLEWILMITGSLIIIFSFLYDFGVMLIEGKYLSRYAGLAEDPRFLAELESYVPDRFLWLPFMAGIGLWLISAGLFFWRGRK